jgi:hypothetical protein
MPTIVSSRAQTKAHDGKNCEVMRSLTPEEDGEAFDMMLAKSIVKLDDGSEVTVANIELQF